METENDSGKCFQKNRRPSADDNCDFSVGKKYRTSIGVVTVIKNEAGLVYINDGMSKGSVAICIDDFKNLSPVSFEDSYDIEDEKTKDEIDEYPVEDELESELSDKKDSGLIVPNSISNFGELVDDVKKLDIKPEESVNESVNESANECTQACAIAPVFGGLYAKYKKKSGGIFQLFADTEDILDDKCGAIEKDEDFDRFVDFGRSNSSKNESVEAVEEKVDEDIDSVSADTKDAIEKYKKRKEEPEGEYIEVIRDQFSKDIKSLMKDAIKEVVRELKDENVKSEETDDAPADEDEYSFNEGDLESDESVDESADEEGEEKTVEGEDSDSSEENEKEKDAEQDEDEETDSDEEDSDDLTKELIANNDLEIDKNDSDENEESSDESDSMDSELDDVSDENENIDHGNPDIEIDEELFTRFKDLMKDMISSIMDEQKGISNGIDEKRRIPED